MEMIDRRTTKALLPATRRKIDSKRKRSIDESGVTGKVACRQLKAEACKQLDKPENHRVPPTGFRPMSKPAITRKITGIRDIEVYI